MTLQFCDISTVNAVTINSTLSKRYWRKRRRRQSPLITLKFSEKEVFLYDPEGLAIMVSDEVAGWSYTARIEFCSRHQMSHFKEMIELAEGKWEEWKKAEEEKNVHLS